MTFEFGVLNLRDRDRGSIRADEELALLALIGFGMADEWPAPFGSDASGEVLGETASDAADETREPPATREHSHEGLKERSIHG